MKRQVEPYRIFLTDLTPSFIRQAVKENELLRNRGNETLLATQWRERFETCVKERDEMHEKLKVYMKCNDGSASGKSIEQAYLDLKEEYKVSNIFEDPS